MTFEPGDWLDQRARSFFSRETAGLPIPTCSLRMCALITRGLYRRSLSEPLATTTTDHESSTDSCVHWSRIMNFWASFCKSSLRCPISLEHRSVIVQCIYQIILCHDIWKLQLLIIQIICCQKILVEHFLWQKHD